MADPFATSGIVATAFDLCEHRAPSTLADDSEEAELANRMYFRALNGALERADWSFARELRALTAVDAAATGLTDDPLLPFTLSLGDAVKVWQVHPRTVRWRRDGIYVRADQAGPLTARVTRKISDETRLPETFQTAVAYGLAVLLAPRLSTSATKKDELKKEAASAMQLALQHDARQGTEERYDTIDDELGPGTGDWITEALR